MGTTVVAQVDPKDVAEITLNGTTIPESCRVGGPNNSDDQWQGLIGMHCRACRIFRCGYNRGSDGSLQSLLGTIAEYASSPCES